METFDGDIDALIAEAETSVTPPAVARIPSGGCNKLSEFEIAEQVAELLPTYHADGYDHWLEVGMAFHSVDAGPAGLTLWKSFSARCPHKYDESDIDRKWRGFKPNGGKTLGTLIKHVRDAGGEIRYYRDQAPTRKPESVILPNAIKHGSLYVSIARISLMEFMLFGPLH